MTTIDGGAVGSRRMPARSGFGLTSDIEAGDFSLVSVIVSSVIMRKAYHDEVLAPEGRKAEKRSLTCYREEPITRSWASGA